MPIDGSIPNSFVVADQVCYCYANTMFSADDVYINILNLTYYCLFMLQCGGVTVLMVVDIPLFASLLRY